MLDFYQAAKQLVASCVVGCQLQLRFQLRLRLRLRLRRLPRRSHLPKVTSARIIFDKAFRQMKFKWLHICWGIPRTPPTASPGHFSSPSLRDSVTCHRSLLNVRSMFIFISTHYAASHYLCLFACLALCGLVVVVAVAVYWHLCLSPIIEEGNAYFK